MILITTAGKVGSQAARLLESDTRGVALTPMLFQATDELASQERIGGRSARSFRCC